MLQDLDEVWGIQKKSFKIFLGSDPFRTFYWKKNEEI